MHMMSGKILKETYPFRMMHDRLYLGYFMHLAVLELEKDGEDVDMSQVQLVIGNKDYGGHPYGDGFHPETLAWRDFNTLFLEIPEVQQQIATHQEVTIGFVQKI